MYIPAIVPSAYLCQSFASFQIRIVIKLFPLTLYNLAPADFSRDIDGCRLGLYEVTRRVTGNSVKLSKHMHTDASYM